MSRQRTLFSIAAMVTVGASAFILPVKQPLTGPALCARRASASTTARALSMSAPTVSQDELKKQVGKCGGFGSGVSNPVGFWIDRYDVRCITD